MAQSFHSRKISVVHAFGALGTALSSNPQYTERFPIDFLQDIWGNYCEWAGNSKLYGRGEEKSLDHRLSGVRDRETSELVEKILGNLKESVECGGFFSSYGCFSKAGWGRLLMDVYIAEAIVLGRVIPFDELPANPDESSNDDDDDGVEDAGIKDESGAGDYDREDVFHGPEPELQQLKESMLSYVRILNQIADLMSSWPERWGDRKGQKVEGDRCGRKEEEGEDG
ncbi:MAG: hypothetical protein Q9166_003570 [cf. Caloplaca sp. 2 TL-2023]